jgi:hypothetical protein
VKRHRILPDHGVLLINTDVHGNLEDFRAVEDAFERERATHGDVHWAILGDVVHAPAPEARKDPFYDYDDNSFAIVRRIAELQKRHPQHVHFVLGNHDHGHVGGPHTSKFYPDEAAALEAKLTPAEIAELRAVFEPAPILVAAPCGVLLCHGSPDTQLTSLDQLDAIPLTERSQVLRSVLTSYGQQGPTTAKMLGAVSKSCGLDLRVVIHGHDRDECGFFYEGGNQVCPIIFGAHRAEKRYARLDLSARYETAESVRDGIELRRLY